MNHALVTYVALFLAGLILLQNHVCHGLDVHVEHSIDGITFQKAASLQAPTTIQSEVIHLESAQDYKASLESLVGSKISGGYYYMRIQSSENPEDVVLSSIPLECWMQAGSQARIELHMNDRSTDKVASISLVAPCPPSSTDGKASVDSCAIVRPRVVAAPALPQQTDRILEPIDQEQSREQSKGQEERKPAKDDRTWLQKNWLFVALAFFILANKLGSAAQEAQQAQGQGSR